MSLRSKWHGSSHCGVEFVSSTLNHHSTPITFADGFASGRKLSTIDSKTLSGARSSGYQKVVSVELKPLLQQAPEMAFRKRAPQRLELLARAHPHRTA